VLLNLWDALEQKKDATTLLSTLADWTLNWEVRSGLVTVAAPAIRAVPSIYHPSGTSSPASPSESGYDSADVAVRFTQGPTVCTPSLDKSGISTYN
jgi:hypothetical protein